MVNQSDGSPNLAIRNPETDRQKATKNHQKAARKCFATKPGPPACSPNGLRLQIGMAGVEISGRTMVTARRDEEWDRQR